MSAGFSTTNEVSSRRQLPLIPRAVPSYNLRALNVTSHSPEDHIILNNSKRQNVDIESKFQDLQSSGDSTSYSSSNFDDSSFFSHKSQFDDEPDIEDPAFTNDRLTYQNLSNLLNGGVGVSNHIHGSDGCFVCENEKLQTALSQPPNSYGIKYLDPKIKKHIVEPKQKYEDTPNLVEILTNKSKGNKSEQNGTIGGIFQDNQSLFSQFDEKAYENLDPDCFFVDGRRKIDFIIALEEKKELPPGPGEDPQPPMSAKARAHEQKLADGRERYLAELEDQGVEIEEAQYDQWDTMITFYKLHITFPLLCDFAEEMNLRMPIKDDLLTEFDNELDNNETPPEFTEYLINQYLPFLPNIFAQKVPNSPKKFMTVPFRKDFLHCFRNSESPEIFFKIRHRISIAMEILRSTSYGDPDRAETGIERLLSEDYFTAAYPLHDTLHKEPKPKKEEDLIEEDEEEERSALSNRQVLWKYWAYWKNWYKYQPLHHVREYFGEKYSIYFYYLGFYTAWMCPIALIGFIIQLCSLFYAVNNPVSKDICNSNYTMCPMCDDCEEWFSEKKCLFSAIGAAFDNGYTIFYAAFISMWSVVFLEFWKRSIAEMGAHWEVYDFAPLEERPRPAYIKQCIKIKKNPVTGKPEPYFPSEVKKTRRIIGGFVLIFIICLIFAVLLLVVIVRSLSTAWVFSWGVQMINDFNVPPIIANGIGTIVQVIGLLIITTVWKKLAVVLTEWEANRTEGEYENSLSMKLSVVAFLELYLPILYIAFFKGKGLGGPGFYTRIVGARLENCPNSDCLWEMAMQLIVFFAVKQWIQNAVELGVPLILSQVNKFLKKRQKREYKKKMERTQEKEKSAEVKTNGYYKGDTEINVEPTVEGEEDEEEGSEEERLAKRTRWEHDYYLNPNSGLFEDYMELMVQFGFVTMFACAFPIGPILALANNIIEIRSDAWKYTALTRRPVPERSKDIGIWFDVLFFLSRLAVFTNAYLMCFTSYYLDRQVYSHVFPEDSGLNHFYNFTLADAPPVYLNATNSEGEPNLPCKYEGYYDSNGGRTEYFWKLLAIKLAYMIAFEHIIFLIGIALEIMIPDAPEDVELRIKREAFIATEIFSPVRNPRDDRTKDGADIAYPDDPFHID